MSQFLWKVVVQVRGQILNILNNFLENGLTPGQATQIFFIRKKNCFRVILLYIRDWPDTELTGYPALGLGQIPANAAYLI